MEATEGPPQNVAEYIYLGVSHTQKTATLDLVLVHHENTGDLNAKPESKVS